MKFVNIINMDIKINIDEILYHFLVWIVNHTNAQYIIATKVASPTLEGAIIAVKY